MSIVRVSFSSPAERVKIVIGIAAVLGAVLLLLWLGFPKIFTGDFADITIESIAATANGQVTMHITEFASCGTPVVVQIFKDRKYVGGGGGSGGTFPRRPASGESGVTFNLNPDHEPVTGRFEDSPLFKRIFVRAGSTHHLRGGQILMLFDFRAADGARYSGFIRVGSSLSAI